jgi:hypothetical protein
MTPDIIIEVRFKTPAEGGRKTAVGSADGVVVDYYSCPLIVDGEAFDCRLLLERRRLELGQIYDVPVKFLNPQLVLPKLTQGKDVLLWEGKEVAIGKVLRVLSN